MQDLDVSYLLNSFFCFSDNSLLLNCADQHEKLMNEEEIVNFAQKCFYCNISAAHTDDKHKASCPCGAVSPSVTLSDYCNTQCCRLRRVMIDGLHIKRYQSSPKRNTF